MSSDSPSQSPDSPPKPNGKHEPGVARDYIAVARGADLVVIRVVGRGSMVTAPALAEFSEEQRKAGFKRFVFDMERCKSLDSTFMGVMVGMHTALSRESGGYAVLTKAESSPSGKLEPVSPREAAAELGAMFARPSSAGNSGGITAINVSAELRELMAMLGVDKFVKISRSFDLKPLETTILPEKNLAPGERRRLILKAHENLVEIDKRNEEQFGAFLKSLSMELAKESL